ncbi:MAG TPA: hypothetical protein PK598_14830, partial [Thermoanaerobaculia bacterium]|nr:hypothetical protein [Thermoanaerobaculia bacterium]
MTDDRRPDDAGPAAGAVPVRAVRRTLGLTSLALAAYQIALTRVSSVLVYTQTTFLVLSVSIAALGPGAAAVHWRRALPRPDLQPDHDA